jgi:hypothetical protein
MPAKLSLTNARISRTELKAIQRIKLAIARLMKSVAQAQSQWFVQGNKNAKNEALKKKTVCEGCRKVKMLAGWCVNRH